MPWQLHAQPPTQPAMIIYNLRSAPTTASPAKSRRKTSAKSRVTHNCPLTPLKPRSARRRHLSLWSQNACQQHNPFVILNTYAFSVELGALFKIHLNSKCSKNIHTKLYQRSLFHGRSSYASKTSSLYRIQKQCEEKRNFGESQQAPYFLAETPIQKHIAILANAVVLCHTTKYGPYFPTNFMQYEQMCAWAWTSFYKLSRWNNQADFQKSRRCFRRTSEKCQRVHYQIDIFSEQFTLNNRSTGSKSFILRIFVRNLYRGQNLAAQNLRKKILKRKTKILKRKTKFGYPNTWLLIVIRNSKNQIWIESNTLGEMPKSGYFTNYSCKSLQSETRKLQTSFPTEKFTIETECNRWYEWG